VGVLQGVQRLVARVLRLRPMRAFLSYQSKRGPILASGLAYQALFSVFAGIWVLFSVAGLVLTNNVSLRERLIEAIAETVPGLVSWGGQQGAIDPDILLQGQTFSVTGIVALVGLLLTALGFLASARDAIRDMFTLPPASGNPILMKLKDVVFLVGFLIVVLVSTVLSVAGTAATGFALGLLGADPESTVGEIIGRVVSLGLVIAIDALVVGTLLTLLGGIRIPFVHLWPGALIGGTGIAVLTVLFQLGIIGGVGSNPLLGSFVVIIGLLIFFNFICQVLLISASFVATELADAGISVTPKEAERMPRHTRVRTSSSLRRSR
jgi:membrane protein